MNPYTEHPGNDAMAFLAERAEAEALEKGYARQRIIREARSACAKEGRR